MLTANGKEVRITLPEVPARRCVDAFDPQATFSTFGVSIGQAPVVRAAVVGEGEEIHALEVSVGVDLMSPAPTPEMLEAYSWCMDHNQPVHGLCAPYFARAAWAVPREVMKQTGRYLVVVPAAWEPLAALTIADMEICFANLEAYLGLSLPAHTLPMLWRFAESGDVSYFAAGSSIIHVMPASSHFFEGVVNGDFPQHSWESVFRNRCSEAHEATHIMVDMIRGLPNWLNEGLAVYMSHPDRTRWYVEGSLRRCEETGFVDINEFTGEETFVPYVALDAPVPEGVPFGNYYATGACFWEYFESTFGHQAFLAVMDALEASRELPGGPWVGCPTFLDLVIPVIGEDIAVLTQERFGFGRDYSLCKIEG